MNKIDLHMHSDVSIDGYYPPEQLMNMCKEQGLTHMAISDHNTVRGTLSLLQEHKVSGIELICAIELDCVFAGKEFHLLGYGIDPYHPIYHEIEHNYVSQEVNNTNFKIDYTKNVLSLQFDDEVLNKLKRLDVVTPESIMEACLQDERNNSNPHMQPYLAGGDRSDNPMVNYYWDHFSQGKPGYKPVHYPDLIAMVKMIHEQGGIAVLAHPGNNVKEDAELLEGIINCGIDGLEVYSSYHSNEQIVYYRDVAEKHKLLKTCGSDFHGKSKPKITLGKCDCSEIEQNELLDVIKGFKKR